MAVLSGEASDYLTEPTSRSLPHGCMASDLLPLIERYNRVAEFPGENDAWKLKLIRRICKRQLLVLIPKSFVLSKQVLSLD